MGNDPLAANSEFETKAVSWLVLTTVVGRVMPLNCTVAFGAKPWPNTASVKPPLPCWTEFGLRLVMPRKLLVGATVAKSVAVAGGAVSWLIVTVMLKLATLV